MKLVYLEFKRFIGSLTFLIYFFLTIAFISVSICPLIDHSLANPPTTNDESDYDSITATDFPTIKKQALTRLNSEYHDNLYTTYMFGFAKNIDLNASKQQQVKQLLSQSRQTHSLPQLHKKLMVVDRLLGGHSDYGVSNLQPFASRPMTPQEAQTDYDLIVHRDKITGTFSRLFADITGLIMGILPTIIVISSLYLDKHAKITQLLNTKPLSTSRLLISRYLALISGLLLPVILVGVLMTIRVATLYPNHSLNDFAFLQVIGFWILPTILISTSVGFITYTCLGNFAGVIIQLGWWISTMNIGAQQVDGNYGWLFIPRHNSTHNVAYYYANLTQLTRNRFGYMAVALLLLLLTIWITNLKKAGYFSEQKSR